MRISYPYMGCVTGFKKLLQIMGHDVIVPSKPTKQTVDLGVKYSPEFICFPFKVMLGTYIEVAKEGAEVILTSGGNGPCRAGLYPEVHQRILKELGYNTKLLVFDNMFVDFKTFKNKIKDLLNGKPVVSLLPRLSFVFKLIRQMDNFEKQVKIIRAYELTKGDTNKAWQKIVQLYDACDNAADLRRAKAQSALLLAAVPVRHVEEKDKMKVGIVGEIYVIMESSVNMNIEEMLNEMGAEVENVQYISDWALHNIQPRWGFFTHSRRVLYKAKKHAPINCGGHDMENVGWMVDFAERGFSGVIHLMPFACLPELVNQSKIPALSQQLNMPILSLSLDEQMGEAHTKTRVEAFIDLIKSRARKSQHVMDTAGKQETLLQLDSGTKQVPGTPRIADTIAADGANA